MIKQQKNVFFVDRMKFIIQKQKYVSVWMVHLESRVYVTYVMLMHSLMVLDVNAYLDIWEMVKYADKILNFSHHLYRLHLSRIQIRKILPVQIVSHKRQPTLLNKAKHLHPRQLLVQ